jgi:putative flippase GtrA
MHSRVAVLLRIINIRFVRFLLVGFLNTLFGYGCFAAFLYIGLHYSVALFLGTIISVLFNFKTTGYFVFKSKDNRAVFHFFAVYAVVFFVNLVSLRIFSSFDVDPYYSGAVLILPMAALAYLLNKTFVFKK